MKMLLIAAAMAVASPAFSQTAAPAADPHAGHTMPADQAGHKMPADHAGHDGCCEKNADGKMACCAKMEAAGKKMACCEDKAAAGEAAADPHAGHDMSAQ